VLDASGQSLAYVYARRRIAEEGVGLDLRPFSYRCFFKLGS